MTVVPQTPAKDRLRHLATDLGFVAVGFTTAEPFTAAIDDLTERKKLGLSADMAFTYRNPARSGDVTKTFPWARSIIVGAWPYPAAGAIPTSPEAPGAVAAYVWEPHYESLRDGLGVVAEELRASGARAQVVADDNALMDRAAAVRAGIGWWGKNTNVLIPDYGSWFVLGSVITDAEFVADPVLELSCGQCRRCIDGCPTQAIIEPGVLDARRCLAWLVQSSREFPVELRPALGGRIYGCDDCQIVCPPNRRPTTVSSEVATAADLDAILDGADADIVDRYGHWYIPKRDVRYVRRNALIAWANTVALDDPDVEGRLERYLGGADLMLAVYAIWAARRLGRDDLVERLDWDIRHDGDPAWRERIERERCGAVPARDTTEPLRPT